MIRNSNRTQSVSSLERHCKDSYTREDTVALFFLAMHPTNAPLLNSSHESALTVRRHPRLVSIPYALDLHETGIHCVNLRLKGPLDSFIALIPLLGTLEELHCPIVVRRELDTYRRAYTNGSILGSVYDLPTAVGWAVMQKTARLDIHVAALLHLTSIVYSLPFRSGILNDDIKPDIAALPEVSPYTELAAILYEALDALLMDAKNYSDLHLRNLYPHSTWDSGVVYSDGQCRLLTAVAPPPRVFSRTLETPIKGQLLAAPGVVRRDGWITFFHALVPSYVAGGIEFDTGLLKQYIPAVK